MPLSSIPENFESMKVICPCGHTIEFNMFAFPANLYCVECGNKITIREE